MSSKSVFLACFTVCQLALSAAFTPEGARRVYGESSFAQNVGIVESGDYVFMEVAWKPIQDVGEDELEAQELSAVFDALKNYVRPELAACTNSPFCEALTSWMVPEFEFSAKDVPSTTIKEYSTNGVHCKIMAFDAHLLRAAKSDAQKAMNGKIPRADSEWLLRLKDVQGNFRTPEEKSKFYMMLGCPVVNVVNSRSPEDYGAPLKGSEACWNELQDIMELPKRPESFFAKNGGLVWTSVMLGTKGAFYPNWQEDDEGRFNKAIELYRKGKDVTKIIKLLSESIAINPIGAEKWGYLGGALKVCGENKDALFAYLQSLKFNPQNNWAWKGLQDCCEKCGYMENAKGLAWYLKMQGER